MAVTPEAGTRVLASLTAPYFNRTWDHFCSHRQTPMDPESPVAYPGITMNAAGNVIYLAHPIFEGYRRQAPLWYKRLFQAALKLLLPDPLVITDAPTTAQITVMRQTAPARTVVHLLHYIPERRGLEFDTIEDVIPLHNVALSIRAEGAPQQVYLAPEGSGLAFTYRDGRVQCVVPRVDGHQMVVLE